jgi:hypothetical protein
MIEPIVRAIIICANYPLWLHTVSFVRFPDDVE